MTDTLEASRQAAQEAVKARAAQIEAVEAMADAHAAHAAAEAAKRHEQEQRTRANREAALAEADERAKTQADQRARLEAAFLRIAHDKPWYARMQGDYTFQWQGVCFGAVARRWILGDEVGMGKSGQAIGYLDLVRANKVIIVTENNIVPQFAQEVRELAPHRPVIVLGGLSPETRSKELSRLLRHDNAVAVVNYEAWRSDRKVLGKLIQWQADTVVVDEAHALKATKTGNFKNIQSLTLSDNVCAKCGHLIMGLYHVDPDNPKHKTAKSCRYCGWKTGEATGKTYANSLDEFLATKSVKNLLLMTGTPILNHPGDLFALLHLIDPVAVPTFRWYSDTFLMKSYFTGRWVLRDGSIDRLQPYLKGRFLARTKVEVGLKLPEQHREDVMIDFDPKAYPLQAKVMHDINEAAMLSLPSGEGEVVPIMALIALITRKRQAAVYPGGIRVVEKLDDGTEKVLIDLGDEVVESIKLDRVVESIVRNHEEGRRQIVFSQFKTALKELARRLDELGISTARLDGDTSKAQRRAIQEDFGPDSQERTLHKWHVLLAQYRSGGTGLNLNGATVVHELDQEWSPGKQAQSRGRVHRLNSIHESTVYRYYLKGSIDTWLRQLNDQKQDTLDQFKAGYDATVGQAEAMSLVEAIKNGEIL
jgi:SNF2 family DNA or RNA helicase